MLTLKYRPKNLTDLIGQEHIKIILEGMMSKYFEGKSDLPAGLLFSGSRGIGKTTLARIIARLLNCDNRKDLVSCGECPSCKAIDDCNNSSVLEIDAASNGLVDDIRKLKDISITSHEGLYRVIIIDEVHGCSSQGFQALLKLLEEPPEGVLFIMATTEPQKVPETVLSRLLCFECKRHTVNDIAERLSFIAKEESIVINSDVSLSIAKYVNGGLRDAVMCLHQLSLSYDEITVEKFERFYGVVNVSYYFTIIENLINKDLGTALINLEDICTRVEPGEVLKGLSEILKNLLLSCHSDDIRNLKATGEKISFSQYHKIFKVILDLQKVKKIDKITLVCGIVQIAEILGFSQLMSTTRTGEVSKDTLKNIFSR